MNAYREKDPALARTAAMMAEARSVNEVVAVLRRTARRIAGSDGIAVVLREGDACVYVAEDAIEPLWQGLRFRSTDCVSGWAMLHDETVVIADVAADPRVPRTAYATKSISSLVMAPIGSPEPVAALGAYWCAMVLLDATTLARIETLARQAGAALSRLRDDDLARSGAERLLRPQAIT